MTTSEEFNNQTLRLEGSRDDQVSPKGARGRMQVMPATARSPGFGVAPAKDDSVDEANRVGRDYGAALLAHYGDPLLAHAAYNAGPGNVDKWIAEFGDPRTGAITPQQFVNAIPFKETRDYVSRIGPARVAATTPVTSAAPTSSPSPATTASPAAASLGLAADPQPQQQAPTFNPLMAFGSVLASGHRLVPVDYDPFTVQPKAQGEPPNLYSPVRQLGALPTMQGETSDG